MKLLILSLGFAAALAADPAVAADPASSLLVQIEPAQARYEGATWSIDDTRPVPQEPAPPLPAPQNPMPAQGPFRSGHRLLGPPNGTHVIVAHDTRDSDASALCRAPGPQAIDIRPGRAHLAVLTFACAAAPEPAGRTAGPAARRLTEGARLTVTITPKAAVDQGAAWGLDDAAADRGSGTSVTGVTDGDHVVHFKAVSGSCIAPAPVVREFHGGQDIALTVAYGGAGCR